MSKFLLAIDVGNTQTVVGIYEKGQTASGNPATGLVGHWRIATVADRTEDELAVLIGGFLAVDGRDFQEDIYGVAISSGVPRVTASLRQMVSRYLDCEPVVIAPGIKTGISILYDNPREVGADRIANAAGAYDLCQSACVVVDFGTGTTFDAISDKGEYLGGAIAPGVEISLDALVGRAAALRAVDLTEPRSVIGKSTVESIQSGVLYGYAAQVDGICDLFAAEMRGAVSESAASGSTASEPATAQTAAPAAAGEVKILATGGIADNIVPFTSSIKRVEPWLTLHGLRIIWEKNQ